MWFLKIDAWLYTFSKLGKEQFYCFVGMEGKAQGTQVDTLEFVGTAAVKQTKK